MSDARMLTRAAGLFVEIVDSVRPEQWGAATPCAEYDVRGLAHHLLFWGPSLVGAGRKEAVPPLGEAESDVEPVADWPTALKEHVARTVEAWSGPGSWDGITHMGGPMELPASMVGGMVVGEFVIHGWDLARATGQDVVWDEDLLEYLLGEVEKTAQMGRDMGIYGPEVEVAETAPVLHRVLGLSGRDPHWSR
ncbi:TIGR03086 family metal-binding protein [Saccharothrix sp.]|uniref:TIGR03086 family metal-binding protein n=1 Tax=Saccharothrix sp. TaxID=1873460 RepID=UPI0028113D74|nr:TIGR03086 family metal-binding protein [Saccharothrix sp.]